jgi:hypothetical protein
MQLPLHTYNPSLPSTDPKSQLNSVSTNYESGGENLHNHRLYELGQPERQISPMSTQQDIRLSQTPDLNLQYQVNIPSALNSAASIDSRNQDLISELSGPLSVASFPELINSDGYSKSKLLERSNDMDGSDAISQSSPRSASFKDISRSFGDLSRLDGNSTKSKASEAEKDTKPAWSELKTKAGKERKRLPLACIACRRKKIRCSGEKPACKHCLRSRIPCVYKVTTRKPAPRTDYMTMLDKRLKRMEERVIKILPDHDTTKLSAIGRASVKPPINQGPKSNTAKKRAAEEAFGSDLNEWAQGSSHGQPSRHFSALDPVENRLLSEGAEHLPSKEIQEHLSEVFFDCLYGQSYHILHKPSFMRKLK